MSDSAPLPSTARLRGIHAEGSTRLLSNRVLQPKEYWWRDHQKWLEEKGYMLRPRFRPEWVPSWGEGEDIFFKNEDSIFISVGRLLFATVYTHSLSVEGTYHRCYSSLGWRAGNAETHLQIGAPL